MRTDTIDLTDPEDLQAARDWAARRAAAALELRQAVARRDLLRQSLAVDPAKAALDAVTTAQGTLGHANDDLRTAQGEKTEADNAARLYEANQVADARQDLDQATADVSTALAGLLAQASTSTLLTATVDGLALRARLRAALATDPPRWDVSTIPFKEHPDDDPVDPEIDLPAVGEPAYTTLREVLARLDDRVDSVADLVTAEGVHQLVNGNPARSGAALDIAATGAVPDDLEVVTTPRPATDLAQRLLLLTDPAAAAAWTAAAPGLAAVADPALAAWVATVVPDPARVGFAAIRTDPAGQPGEPLPLTADRLGLDPLGWARVSADRGELAARIARLARDHWRETLGDDADLGGVTIHEAGPGLMLRDLLAAAGAARLVMAAARALAPDDLTPPTAAPADPDEDAVDEALAAVDAAEKHVAEVLAALRAAPDGDREAVLDAMFAAAGAGVAEAMPELDLELPSVAALRAQAAIAAARLAERTAGATPPATVAEARARLTQLAGARQLLLTTVALPDDPLLRADLRDGAPRIAGAGPAVLRDWLHRHRAVRPAADALGAAYDLAETLGCAGSLDLRAVQLPAADPDRWSGDDPAPRAGVVTAVVARGYRGAAPARCAGLAVDSWTHHLPAAGHATGVAFDYDRPNATAPQAILVAVAPDLRAEHQPATWDLDTLLDTVTSAFALAAERVVSTDQLPADGQITVPDVP